MYNLHLQHDTSIPENDISMQTINRLFMEQIMAHSRKYKKEGDQKR